MSHKPLTRNNGSRERERQALLSYAFFRWESAVTLAMTLLLAILLPDPFRGAVSWWGWWMWIGLGVLAEALIVGTTLTDRDLRARIASQLFRERFDLDAISDGDMRQQFFKALDTREQMQVVIQRSRGAAAGSALGTLGDEVSSWIETMYTLARRLDEVQDRAALHSRQDVVERAALQLDEHLTALEAIYTQMQLVAARGAEGRRVRKLREEIAGRAQSLSELDREIAGDLEQTAAGDRLNPSG
jgi:hypothetical protein